MNILFTLDYELFLGARTGTVRNCLITPMRQMIAATERYGVKFTLFVDATYLYRLHELSHEYPVLAEEHREITEHLLELQRCGHDLQLHIHPHWHYSIFDGKEWKLDHDHYKLCDLPVEEAELIFAQTKDHLDAVIGKKTIAFRAGGFSTQPTCILRTLFEKHAISVDASVCPGTVYDSPQQQYDYLSAPVKDCYRFTEDICREENGGKFVEVPISMHRVSPLFYWRYVATRLLKLPSMRLWGDGRAVKATGESIRSRLMGYTPGMATIDGYKCSLLQAAYRHAKQKGNGVLCVIGHPKLASAYSVKKLGDFCRKVQNSGDTFVTISELVK